MGPLPSQVGRVLAVSREASARALRRDLVNAMGRALCIGTGAGVVAIGLAKVGGFDMAWPWLAGVPLGVSAAWAGVIVWRRKWTPARGARALDAHFKSNDRLISALELSAAAHVGPFAQVALQEGEAFATTVEPRRAIPIRFENHWWIAGGLCAGSILAGLYLPARAVHSGQDRLEVAHREEALSDVRRAIRAVAPTATQSMAPSANASELKTLSEIERELSAGTLTPQEARARSAGELTQAANELDHRTQQDRIKADHLRTTLAQAAAASHPDQPATAGDANAGAESGGQGEFERALSKGDIAAAAEAARELAAKADTLSPEEKQRLAADLQRLSDRLEATSSSPPLDHSPDSEPSDADTPRTGSPEHPDTPNAGDDAHQPREGMPPEGQPDSGDRSNPPKPSSDPREAAQQDARELSKAMREAAKELREQPITPPPSDGSTPPQPNEPVSKPEASSQPKDGSPQSQPASKPENGGASSGPQRVPRQQGSKPQDSLETQKPDASKGGQPQAQPGQQSGSATSSDKSSSAQPQPKQGESPSNPQSGKPGETSAPSGNDQKQSTPNSPQSTQPIQQTPQSQTPSGESKAGDTKAGESKSGESQPNASKPDEAKPGEIKPAVPTPGQTSPAPSAPSPSSQGKAPEGGEPNHRQGSAPAGGNTAPKPESNGSKPDQKRDAPSATNQPAPGQGSAKDQPSGKTDESPAPSGSKDAAKPQGSESHKNAPQSGKPDAKGQPQDSDQQPQPQPESGKPVTPLGDLPDQLPSASALEKLAKQFEKQAKGLSDSRMSREQAEKYREQAQRLLENASPQQRQQLEDLARKLAANNSDAQQSPGSQPDRSEQPQSTGPGAQPDDAARLAGQGPKPPGAQGSSKPGPSNDSSLPRPGPAAGPGSGGPRLANDARARESWQGETDVVDARRSDRDAQSEKTIAEWYNPNAPAGTGVERTSPAAPAQGFQHAAEGAERAIEQRAVPNQYADFVRRVFGRYVQRTQGAAPPGIENAPDATPTRKP